jgi:hypothetical protein
VEHQGLIGNGQNIKTLGKDDVVEAKVCRVFGLKFDKNGWKFKLHTNKEI